ncbi:MAG: substrate-binding domain-containing protein, partial [Phycisphaerae bacterium]|nr:substrate-binding domain-containing protein [Phycisphaerae bacterium]
MMDDKRYRQMMAAIYVAVIGTVLPSLAFGDEPEPAGESSRQNQASQVQPSQTVEETQRAAKEALRRYEEALRTGDEEAQRVAFEEARRMDDAARRRIAEEHRRRQEEQLQRNKEIRQQFRAQSLCFAGTDTAYSVLEKLYAAFCKDRENIPMRLDYTGGGDDIGVQELISGRAEAALLREVLTETDKEALKTAFPNPDFQPTTVELGRLALIIVTNDANPVRGLTLKQLEDIYRGTTTKWSDVNGAGNEIVRIGTDYPQLSWGMFLDVVLKNKSVKLEDLPFRPEGYTNEEHRAFEQKLREKYKATDGKPFAMLASDDKVLVEVAKNRAAIGYCIHPAGKALPKGVRWVPIIPEGSKEAVAPTQENVLLGKYPLQVTIRWLVSPRASDTCKEFIRFVCSEEATSVLQAGAIFPGRAGIDLHMATRLAGVKSGKGVRLSSVGIGEGKTIVPDLVTEYVKARTVVLLNYTAVDSDVSAVGAFISGSAGGTGGSGVRELLLLSDKPSPRAMEVHGAKWSSLGVGEDGKPDGTGPVEYV